MTVKRKNGYVLLTMLLLMLSASAGWVSLSVRQPGSSRTGLPLIDAQRLADARQSMLSYAALYPYLYGPAGAGPGHLPCPDTDGYTQTSVAMEPGYLQRRDGANPPCASMDETDGYLPRHTVLPSIRYLFHAEPWQRFKYRVSEQLINNPVNRIVNLDTLDRAGHRALAFISLSSSDDSSILGQVAISGKSLRFAMASSVAAWVSTRAAQTSHVVTPLRCESDRLLTIIYDTPLQFPTSGCLADSPELNRIEGVPAARHWFFRNRWHEWVNVVDEQDCKVIALSTTDCRLVYPTESRHGVGDTNNTIVLFLRPDS